MKRGRATDHDGGDDDDHEADASLHAGNLYRLKKPDFAAMPSLAPFVDARRRLDWTQPAALAALTRTLLADDFGLAVELGPGLCPTVTSRLEYVLWVHDLLAERRPERRGRPVVVVGEESCARYDRASWGGEDDVCGLDVGTGASCIYPLLGARLFGWRWVASELDPASVQCALRNVVANNVDVQVVQVPHAESGLCAALALLPAGPPPGLTFTMCNPPFFGEADEAGQNPHRTTTITNSEAATEGGEVAFVRRLIDDSLVLHRGAAPGIEWFTSLCGKKASLRPLKAHLHSLAVAVVVRSQRLCVGRTHRWVLGWSFHAELVEAALPPAAASASLTTDDPRALFDRVRAYLNEELCLELLTCDTRTLSLRASLTHVCTLDVQLLLVEKPAKWALRMRSVEGDAEMADALQHKIRTDLRL